MTMDNRSTSSFGDYSSLLSNSGVKVFDASARVLHASNQYAGYGFIALLGLAQRLQVNFLPPTWHAIASVFGKGGQATINYALLESPLSLALKIFNPSLEDPLKEIVQEMAVLSHPAVRSHEHIVRLQGLSFEILSEDEVRPMLVFQRSHLGDLSQFVRSERFKHLSIGEKLNLCADVGFAFRDMHHNRNDLLLQSLFESKRVTGIIHGDIKPSNVLVFENGSRIVAKVADFGCATHFQSEDDMISLPISEPWNAPEHKGQNFYPLQAKRADTYSFALLCAWLLSETGSPSSSSPTNLAFVGAAQYTSKISLLRHLKASNDEVLVAWAVSVVRNNSCLDNGTKVDLTEFFESTLTRDPQSRCIELGRLLHLLVPNRAAPVTNEIQISFAPDEEVFELPRSFLVFYDFDFRLRTFILESLETIAMNSEKPLVKRISPAKAALQMMLCCDVGFANDEDFKQAVILTHKNSIHPDHINEYMRMNFGPTSLLQMEKNNLLRDTPYSTLKHERRFQVVDFSSYYRERDLLETAEAAYAKSLKWLEQMFGEDDLLVLKLESRMAAIIADQGRGEEAEKLIAYVAEKASKTLGGEHPLTLSCRNKLAYALLNQGRFEEAENLVKRGIELLSRSLGDDHPLVLASMNDLGSIYINMGHWVQGEHILKQTFELSSRVLGEGHPRTLACESNIVLTLLHHRNYEEEEITLQPTDAKRGVLRGGHASTLISPLGLTETYVHQEQLKEAETRLVKLTGSCSHILGDGHTITFGCKLKLASIYRVQGLLEEARMLERQVQETCKEVLGPQYSDT